MTAAALTAEHRRHLMALRAATLRDLHTLWPSWNAEDLRTWDRFVTLSTILVRSRYQVAAGLGAAYFAALRDLEGVPGAAAPVFGEGPGVEELARSMAATGLVGVIRGLSVGMSMEAARANGFVRLAGAVGRHVLDGSRETIIGSVRSDPRAVGWERVTSANPCDFCLMLESRGAVYKEWTVDFQAHDNCACTAEPGFEGSGAPFEALWNAATQGRSGAEAMHLYGEAARSARGLPADWRR